MGKDSEEFGTRSTVFLCRSAMVQLVESRSGHASGALRSETEFGWRDASGMMQNWTRGRMCDERFSMKETNHQTLPHSCSTANACNAQVQFQHQAKTNLCTTLAPLPCDYRLSGTSSNCLREFHRVSASIWVTNTLQNSTGIGLRCSHC